MRRSDLELLSKPYNTDENSGGAKFYSAIGADLPYGQKLSRAVFLDLEEPENGVAFFSSMPDQERILISDYLYQCVSSIETNLGEASLHYLEWLHCSDEIDNNLADVLTLQDGTLDLNFPPSKCAVDDLPNQFEKLHVSGYFRALGSSFDCLGATIVGVLGLQCALRTASMQIARNALTNVVNDGSDGARLQSEFGLFFEETLDRCGPNQWFRWLMQYRNMFVHRGRRLSFSNLRPREPLLFDANGKPIPRVRAISHLIKFPDKTDIEAAIAGRTGVLNEAAEITLQGIFSSTKQVLDKTTERLFEIWELRKRNPALIAQPLEQWSKESKICSFGGYRPENGELEMDVITANPTVERRFRAASVFDHQRFLWSGSKWTS